MAAMAIARFVSLKMGSRGKGSLGQSLRHLDKHFQSAEITRPELSHENRSYITNPPSYKQLMAVAKRYEEKHNTAVDEWNRTHDKPKRRHLKQGASQFIEGLFTYSPEMEGKISVSDWAEATINFIKREFKDKGCKVARCELHRDEKTTHISFVALSWNEEKQKTSVHDILGDRKDLCELQDRYAESVAQFGLERGFSRYRAFESVRKKALASGYGNSDGTITTEQVKQYAADHNIEIPKYRGHKPIGVWKAEQNELGMALEQRNKTLARSLSDLEQIKEELSELIPEHYCEVVNRAESSEALLKMGKSIGLTVGGREISLTDYLIEQDRRHTQKMQSLLNDLEL